MTVGTLYYSIQEGEPLRTRAILPYSLIKHYKIDVDLSGPDEHFPSEFVANHVPSFRYASGKLLTESIPIALMLTDLIPNKGGLLGDGSNADIARVLSWLNVLNLEFMDKVAIQFTMVIGRRPYDAAKFDQAGAAVDRQLTILNDHLTKNTYLVGEKLSLADLYGVPMLLRGLQQLWGPEYRAKFPAVMRWYNTVSKSPMFDGFFDSVELTTVSKKPKSE